MFLTTFFQQLARKYLVIERLWTLPYKRGFINSNILETWKDRPNTPPSLKVLKERIHKLVGVHWHPPPPPGKTTLWRTKSLDQEGLSWLVFDPRPLSKMEIHSTIYDSKIFHLWTTKPCLKIIRGLLVFVFDKVSKPSSPDLQPNTRRVICKMQFFRKAKIVQRNKSYIFLRATSGRQSVLSMYQIKLKAYRMLWSYTLLKSKNNFKIFNLHDKSSHSSNCCSY